VLACSRPGDHGRCDPFCTSSARTQGQPPRCSGHDVVAQPKRCGATIGLRRPVRRRRRNLTGRRHRHGGRLSHSAPGFRAGADESSKEFGVGPGGDGVLKTTRPRDAASAGPGGALVANRRSSFSTSRRPGWTRSRQACGPPSKSWCTGDAGSSRPSNLGGGRCTRHRGHRSRARHLTGHAAQLKADLGTSCRSRTGG